MVDGSVEGREVGDVDEALRIEVAGYLRIAPVYRQASGQHRLNKFLGRIAGRSRILKSQGEFVIPDEGELVRDGRAEIIEMTPAGIDVASSVKLPEKPVSFRATWV